jgi:hypothetical protein
MIIWPCVDLSGIVYMTVGRNQIEKYIMQLLALEVEVFIPNTIFG